jgi:phi13 family phage major tail protein
MKPKTEELRMSRTKNKVKYNLKNVHFAKATFTDGGGVSFAKPKPIPGAVSLSLDANGEPENFYADGIAYYVINNNMGYDGDLELALIPEDFRMEILSEQRDNNGVLVENINAQLEHFALLFEFDGDQRQVRHVLHNCTASRPKIEGKTIEEKKEVQTESLTLSATPLSNGIVKAKTGDETDQETYENWYQSVYIPVIDSGSANADGTDLSALSIGNLTLTPAFDAGTTAYTATTTNATNTVTATAADDEATVAITVNGSEHTSGQAATWESGENTVTIVVTKGTSSKTYTITVTKEE